MAAPPFATADDLSAYLLATNQQALTDAQKPGAAMLLAAISQAVRRETRQQITAGTATAEIQGHRMELEQRGELLEFSGYQGYAYHGYGRSSFVPVRRDLMLPQQPVQAVQAVLVNGTAVSDWELHGGQLWRDDGWPGWITVTWTYGYPEVPEDIKGYVLVVTSEALKGPVPLLTEQIVEYSYTRGPGLPGDHLGLGMAALKQEYSIATDVLVRSARY